MRRQQLDAACDSHRTHCPSSPSCCSLSSSSASLVIRDIGHRCRPRLITYNTVISAPIARATVPTRHWSSRFSASLCSTHTIPHPNLPESKFLVSRPRPPAISAASKPNYGGDKRSRIVPAFARRSPESSLLLARSSVVEALSTRLGNGLRTQQRPRTHGHSNRRSRVGETRHRPARAYHALDSHRTQSSPKNISLQDQRGKAQCRPLSQGRLLYTMMMSAAVLARGLIGTC